MASGTRTARISSTSGKATWECPYCSVKFPEDTKSVQCDACNSWVCLPCSKIPSEMYELMNKFEKKSAGLKGFKWVCKLDERALPTLQEMNTTLSEIKNSNNERFDAIDRRMNEIESSIGGKVQDEVTNLQDKLKSELMDEIDKKLDMRVREESERRFREMNVVLFNVPLSESSDPQIRKKHDIDQVLRLFQATVSLVRSEQDEEPMIKNCFRLKSHKQSGEGAGEDKYPVLKGIEKMAALCKMMSLIGTRSQTPFRLSDKVSRCLLSQGALHLKSPSNSLHQISCTASRRLLRVNNLKNVSVKDLTIPRPFARWLSNGMRGQFCILVHRSGYRTTFIRFASSGRDASKDTASMVLYIMSLLIVMIGLTYAAVPAYKVFCRQFGLGGNTEYSRAQNAERVVNMEKIEERVIKVRFTADTAAAMTWKFKPQQAEIKVVPGETALAFYSATNPTAKPVIGISTYSVSPPSAALYFNKIQCFCFEEQILNPGEQVDLPVFFYIDPEYDNDLELEFTDEITLSYTFFEAREGLDLPLPGFMKQQLSPEPTA